MKVQTQRYSERANTAPQDKPGQTIAGASNYGPPSIRRLSIHTGTAQIVNAAPRSDQCAASV